MASQLDWAEIASRFLDGSRVFGPVPDKIAEFQHVEPLEMTEALDAESAEGGKKDSTAFLIAAIRDAVRDHALTEKERRELEHVKRIFRIHEGDFLRVHEEEVTDLLCEELERLLEDREIDPDEAIHKAKLQDFFDLGYDEFINLTSSEVDKIIVDLLYVLTAGGREGLSRDDVSMFHRCLAALDTVYDLNSPDSPRSPRSGYLYLLINPSMPGLVKLGTTSRAPEQRVVELTSATGVPEPFVLLYEIFVQDAPSAETWVHEQLETRDLRHSGDREFFSVAPNEAVELMMEAHRRFSLT